MPAKPDPEWEVVDELPGEKRPKTQQKGLVPLFKSKKLWAGLIIGASIVILFPVFRVLLLGALRAWWIWLGIALFWTWRRMQRASKK